MHILYWCSWKKNVIKESDFEFNNFQGSLIYWFFKFISLEHIFKLKPVNCKKKKMGTYKKITGQDKPVTGPASIYRMGKLKKRDLDKLSSISFFLIIRSCENWGGNR